MDEFTREGLALEVGTSLPSARVLAVLQGLVVTHGAPQFVRSDNGPEFIALAVRGWLAQHQTTTVVHRPRLSLAKWIWGALQRHRARRMSEYAGLSVRGRGPSPPRYLSPAVSCGTSAQ